MIWAQNSLGVIGADGGMPWHLPEDLERFREVTTGNVVIMGKRTWESIGSGPLPDRMNVVLGMHGMELRETLLLNRRSDIFIIGGAKVYRSAMQYADRLLVTEVMDSTLGDAFAPVVDQVEWVETESEENRWRVSSTGLRYRYLEYVRRSVAIA